MTNLFPITSLQENKYLVSWPRWDSIRQFNTKKLLIEVLFEDMGITEVGFLLSVIDDEMDIMWVNLASGWHYLNGEYARYLEDMYTIKGVAFNSEYEAQMLQDYLEKKYIWKTLQA